MIDFFVPYIGFLYGAAYNIQQTLEGYGLSSSNFIERNSNGEIVGSYWSPSETVLVPFGVVIIYAVILGILLLAAGYVLGKSKGVIVSLLAILTPGILHVLGYWPDINYIPSKYVIGGTGVLGGINGFIPILVLALLSGWSLTIIAFDLLNLGEKYRNYFDHLWYYSAIIAGIFFVYDSGTSKISVALKEENQLSRNASLYLLDQVKKYYEYCTDNDIAAEKPSCRWASAVQQKLVNYSAYNEKIFFQLGPESIQDIYFPILHPESNNQVIQIREEIKAYNELKCPITHVNKQVTKYSTPSADCQSVPAVYCRSFPEPPKDLVDRYIVAQTLALASECIIPNLVRSRVIQEDLVSQNKVDALNRHKRWLFFILFAFVAGEKVANASTKAIQLDKREVNEKRRIYKLLLRLLRTIRNLTRLLIINVRSLSQGLNKSG